MAGDIETEKAAYQTRKDSKAKSPAKPSEVDMAHGKKHNHSHTSPAQVEVSNFNSKESGLVQELPAEQEKYSPTTNCYEYYYPGYDGTFGEWKNMGYRTNGAGHDLSYLGNPRSSVVYYVPGYDTYAPGMLMPPGGQYFAQPPFCLTAMYSQPFSSPATRHGTDGVQNFSRDSVPLVDDGLTTSVGFGNPKINLSGKASEHSEVSNRKNPSIIPNANDSTIPSSHDSSCISSSSAKVPAPAILSGPLKPSSKVPIPRSDFQGALIPRNRLPHGNFVPYPSQGKGGLLAESGAKTFIPNSRGWHSNDTLRTSGKFNLNGSFEKMAEQSRGPRANKIKGSPFADEISDKLNPAMRRDQYNLLEFETKYDHALFFVIKSFNEDDVHKSIKYNVWASTPSGNEKLDAAFHDAEKKSCEKGSRCPVFLFFSVNASGQFCGLAEMIGIVDFKKNMDFWQQGKWNGFFPVKWHIIKDIPNSQFRHILLKNNENKQVTNSRDTQEIELLQGLEMLKIFKDYAAKDSILDDFGYYERREKLLMKNRITSQLVGEDGEKTNPLENANHHSLVAHAKNLSLSGGPDGARAHPSGNS
ncbi:YTH domain-containing protein ECT4-like isoform X1 [Nymphaea colorata]|nr:YTH domain-containing protein ECT4-like isoform X1 [Nymphaea colorata]XP_031497016.1 YTH domain-containing protein ECT4-like isoform X1 [Nymphaea colorata]XP_031497024.1 YTH domain-containing protein ECT4-like isoform X1 [Nymphaea colorata]XP_031497033.1 YTH domain-containing protein ECT4-like isoform X1 [Nymphaea colorata]XP_031497043.1 YTH domain-containing protein ECT4-like isoform X1 [Nymphaea colorata]XP_049935846.1 YTH domain-containing protein ECT4-like isoform X1 [Nymphaea colorata]